MGAFRDDMFALHFTPTDLKQKSPSWYFKKGSSTLVLLSQLSVL